MLCLIPAARVDLLVAADERRGGRMECLEPAHRGVRTQHLPRRRVLGKTLEGNSAKNRDTRRVRDSITTAPGSASA